MTDTERAAIVAWYLRDKALELPALKGWRGFLWAVFHPGKFGEYYGAFFALTAAADAIERGDHIRSKTHD